MNFSRSSFPLAFIAFFLAAVSFAQNTGSITGRVIDDQGQPITDARVTLVETRATVNVDATGTFTFSGLPAAYYHVLAESRRAGSAVGEVDLATGATGRVEIELDPAVHSEEIVVSASVDTRGAGEVYQPVSVVNQEELAERAQPTLGETLAQEPGVTSTYFGPGSSRPVIRGFGSDRIRILEEGVGTADASNVSPDHAVSVESSTAEQIEIVRGPATLLYGSNAVGGVVNVVDRRIPASIPTEPVTGTVQLRGGTVADERGGSISLDGGFRPFAWHLDYSKRETGDYDIPGPAQHQHEGEEPVEDLGYLENSSLDTQNLTGGVSFVGAKGYFGIAANQFETNYGIPPGAHEHHEGEEGEEEEEEEEEFVRIDMQKQRFDLKGELTNVGRFFRNVRLRVGSSDYEHVELEGSEVGTRFLSDGIEGRLEASHNPVGALRGAFGVQLSTIDFEAIGAEAFIPPTSTSSRAAFAFEEFSAGKWDVQLGARYENSEVDADLDADLNHRSFSGLSGSAGAIFRPIEALAVALSLTRAVRAPTAQELFANGPHIATGQFEVGDPNLDEEISLGFDASLRKTSGRVRGELSMFENRFDGYIFEQPTADEEDELPVFRYEQRDARFRGFEVDTHTELAHWGENHLELELGADYVRATLDGGGDLPRIPPFRASVGLRYQGPTLSASSELIRYAAQNDVAELEEETEGYTLVNATVGYRLLTSRLIHDFLLRATNLTDELARSHVSPLKERAPLPGRDLSLSYRVSF